MKKELLVLWGVTVVVAEIHSEVFMRRRRQRLIFALKHASKISAGAEPLRSGARVTLNLDDGRTDTISTTLRGCMFEIQTWNLKNRVGQIYTVKFFPLFFLQMILNVHSRSCLVPACCPIFVSPPPCTGSPPQGADPRRSGLPCSPEAGGRGKASEGLGRSQSRRPSSRCLPSRVQGGSSVNAKA